MKSKEIIEALEPWMRKVCRPAWRPVVEPGDGALADSKFGGTPWTGPDAPWPTCMDCETPLALLLQLRLGDLPASLHERHGAGLLQLFYCADGSCPNVNGYMPFNDECSLARIVQPTTNDESPLPGHQHLPAHRIVGWDHFDDLPDAQEHEENGLRHIYDFQAGTIRLECPEIGFDVTSSMSEWKIEQIADAARKDKLAGWPSWVQGIEYPSCPQCGRLMNLVLQLGSDDHVAVTFGDGGTGHVTQCPEHKDVVAFGWACG